MPGSYSTDLREHVLVAVEAGEAPEAVAERFVVGRAAKPMIHGEVEAALRRLLEGNNHLTLSECRDRLAGETRVRVHPWTVGRTLRRLDWT